VGAPLKASWNDNMNWWKILIAYCCSLARWLWFYTARDATFEDKEQAPRD